MACYLFGAINLTDAQMNPFGNFIWNVNQNELIFNQGSAILSICIVSKMLAIFIFLAVKVTSV